MKTFFLSWIALFILNFLHAQNTFPTNGNVGIGTVNPASSLQVIGITRLGNSKNYLAADSSGNLSFTGKAVYRVSANKYVFQVTGNASYGLFFNGTNSKYEFRNSSSKPVFNINAGNGDITTSGNIFLDSNVYLQGKKFISISDTNNLFIGTNSGLFNTASYNTTTGYNAMYSNQTGYACTAVGAQSLYSNISGRANTATGAFALTSDLIGEANTATGAYALYSDKSGDGNTATGTQAMYYNIDGYHNTSTGVSSLYYNQSGAYQSAHGFEALYYNTTGTLNTATAYHALYKNTTGSYNVAMGVTALLNNTTGSQNTGLGANTNVAAGNLTNATVIGYSAVVNASNKVVIGNSNVTVIGGQVGWSTLSDLRFKKNLQANIPGLVFINKLKPLTYTLDTRKYEKFLGIDDSVLNKDAKNYTASEKIIRSGFIAQDVEKAAKEINYNFDGVHAPANDKDNYSLVYAALIPSLVKAVQELSKENDSLKIVMQQIQTALQKITGKNASAENNAANVAAKNTGIFIDQNQPNPSGNFAVIKYILPKTVKQARLIILTPGGNIIFKQNIISTDAQVNVDISRFATGVYNYFIMADNNISESKKMLIER